MTAIDERFVTLLEAVLRSVLTDEVEYDTGGLAWAEPQATAEPAFIASAEGQALAKMGDAFTPSEQIGNASGIRLLPGGRFEAAAETTRGGGGSALVARPDRNR